MTGRPKSRPPAFEKAGSGLDEAGNWTPVFPGQRSPFPRGVSIQQSHGVYVSPLKLGPRPQEIADAVRPYVTGYTPAVEATLQTYAITLCRLEKANEALERVEQGDEGAEALIRRKDTGKLLLSLQASMRGWIRLSLSLAGELGLTPSASARIMRDVGIGAHAAAAHAALLERYRGVA
jgi:hypothetical protein